MRKIYFMALVFLPFFLSAQPWVDSLYSIETTPDISYGTTIDFAGNERILELDISVPVNDDIPECGRPLVVIVHGGSFVTGSKNDFLPVRMRQDFAERGYVAAAVNYRLGQFQTHSEVHCNISNFGVEWDCLNMADTSEWYRAYYRGIQDVNGAIRYLINHSANYHIDPSNVFIIGESAGGFIAMGAGFLDNDSEVLNSQITELPDMLPPNSIYESPCVQHYQLDTSIASMTLERPNLGSYLGELNWPLSQDYQIRGVGNFYGGAFNNIFGSTNEKAPALYLFHQPNDLIVPCEYNRVFAGYAYCATQFPAFCSYIINRPYVYGSKGIKTLIDNMELNGQETPDYLFEHTENTADCLLQIANADLQGHRIDQYETRTNHLAVFFADHMVNCLSGFNTTEKAGTFSLYPNPGTTQQLPVLEGPLSKGDLLSLYDVHGRPTGFQLLLQQPTQKIVLETGCELPSGIYILLIQSHQKMHLVRWVVTDH